ncbi:unnamed protein product [Dicrocoelium dendriticum]|nr:unnamed protein product [Dicrocoelium dendriticum]
MIVDLASRVGNWHLIIKRAVLLYIGYRCIKALLGKRTQAPGPIMLPWIGYIPCLGPSALREVAKLHKTYGDVVRITLMGRPIVFLNTYEAICEAAITNKRKIGRHTPTINDWLAKGRGISNYDTPRAMELRQALLRYLYNNGPVNTLLDGNRENGSLSQAIQSQIDALVDELNKTAGEPVSVTPIMRRAVWRIMWEIVFGHKCDMESADIDYMFHRISGNNMENTVLSCGQLMDKHLLSVAQLIPVIRRMFRVQRLAKRYTQVCDVLNDAVKRVSEESVGSSSLIDRLKRDTRLSIETGELERLAFELMAAGTETSSTTLTWACVYMSEHPELFVQEDIDRHLKNIHRLASVVPLGLPYITKEPVTISGYHVPKGTILLFNLLAVHQEQSHILDDPPNPIPFSVGARSCPGGRLAGALLKHIVSTINAKFLITEEGDRAIGENECPRYDTGGLTRGPSEGLFVFHPRRTM